MILWPGYMPTYASELSPHFLVYPVNEYGNDFIQQIPDSAHGVLFATGELVCMQGASNTPEEAGGGLLE